jgi:hypothetical protein
VQRAVALQRRLDGSGTEAMTILMAQRPAQRKTRRVRASGRRSACLSPVLLGLLRRWLPRLDLDLRLNQ